MNEINAFNFTFFYWALIICGLIGVFSAIYKKPIDRVMEETEERSNGRTAH